MSPQERFFGLTRHEVAELGITIEHGERTATIKASSSRVFDLTHGVTVDQPRDESKYLVEICCTGFPGESNIINLKEKLSSQSIGYIFPVTSFRTGEYIEGVWPRRYAEVGFRKITNLEKLSAFSESGSIDSFKEKTLCLDDVISDEVGILVVGVEQMQRLGMTLDMLELLLLKDGITIVRSLDEVGHAICKENWRSTINISVPDEIILSESVVLRQLFKSADADITGVGAFLLMYQAFEFCIDHIFAWAMHELARGGLTTWDMKARLSEVTGERFRLGVLDSKCLTRLTSRSSLDELKESSKIFLLAVGVEDQLEDQGWASLVYKVRNVIVHNQIKMMKAPQATLFDLNRALRQACLDILLSFSKPTVYFANPSIVMDPSETVLEPPEERDVPG
ncbi:hypothetical protein [Methylobacterium sp. NEAU K]|uniref:hypothetical protein n=1 Tax=Methylobacterium sp. NEAU K TaxID=3064946 RepID=UPI002733BBDA|nr:hypothetical protein [Methylobacterium sp. NEAU K]MDP4005776.1 hypothetical protein [Methylobacterium sp. NEAU K]